MYIMHNYLSIFFSKYENLEIKYVMQNLYKKIYILQYYN